jgi:hypothetical protein
MLDIFPGSEMELISGEMFITLKLTAFRKSRPDGAGIDTARVSQRPETPSARREKIAIDLFSTEINSLLSLNIDDK